MTLSVLSNDLESDSDFQSRIDFVTALVVGVTNAITARINSEYRKAWTIEASQSYIEHWARQYYDQARLQEYELYSSLRIDNLHYNYRLTYIIKRMELRIERDYSQNNRDYVGTISLNDPDAINLAAEMIDVHFAYHFH